MAPTFTMQLAQRIRYDQDDSSLLQEFVTRWQFQENMKSTLLEKLHNYLPGEIGAKRRERSGLRAEVV